MLCFFTFSGILILAFLSYVLLFLLLLLFLLFVYFMFLFSTLTLVLSTFSFCQLISFLSLFPKFVSFEFLFCIKRKRLLLNFLPQSFLEFCSFVFIIVEGSISTFYPFFIFIFFYSFSMNCCLFSFKLSLLS